MTPKSDNTGSYAIRGVGLGILYMVVALIGQQFVQSMPVIIFLFYHGFNVSSLLTLYTKLIVRNYILYSIFIGIVAGVFQESSTYIAVDTRNKNVAIYIGVGFAVVDIAILLAEMLFYRKPISSFQSFIIFLNVLSPMLFHPGTATFMKWGRLIDKGKLALLLSILIHSIVDGGLVYADYYINFHPSLYYISVYEYWSMVMVISAGIFITGTLLLRSVEDIEIPPEPVVY